MAEPIQQLSSNNQGRSQREHVPFTLLMRKEKVLFVLFLTKLHYAVSLYYPVFYAALLYIQLKNIYILISYKPITFLVLVNLPELNVCTYWRPNASTNCTCTYVLVTLLRTILRNKLQFIYFIFYSRNTKLKPFLNVLKQTYDLGC